MINFSIPSNLAIQGLLTLSGTELVPSGSDPSRLRAGAQELLTKADSGALYQQINAAAGVLSLNAATGAVLISSAGTNITVSTSGTTIFVSGSNIVQSGDLAATGQQAWSAAQNNATNLSGNLTTTGVTLRALTLGGDTNLSGNLTTTGSTLFNLTIGGDTNLSGNLTQTGVTLRNLTLGGDTNLSGNLALTGSNLYVLTTGLSGQAVAAYVALVGAQTITGLKTFNSGIFFGNVGIGTGAPTHTLDVYIAANSEAVRFGNGTQSLGFGANTPIGGYVGLYINGTLTHVLNGNGGISIGGGEVTPPANGVLTNGLLKIGTNQDLQLGRAVVSSAISVLDNGGNARNLLTDQSLFFTAAGAGQFTGKAFVSGSAGIGTTNPQQSLHVSGGNARFDGSGFQMMSVPTGQPGPVAFSLGGQTFVSGGALYYIGSAGTITKLANA